MVKLELSWRISLALILSQASLLRGSLDRIEEHGHPPLLGRYERWPHSTLDDCVADAPGHCDKNQLPRPKNRNSGFQRFAKNDTVESFKNAVYYIANRLRAATGGTSLWKMRILPREFGTVPDSSFTQGICECCTKNAAYQYEILIIFCAYPWFLHAVEISALTKCDAHVTLNLAKIHKNGRASKT